jgi:hypothetical protein
MREAQETFDRLVAPACVELAAPRLQRWRLAFVLAKARAHGLSASRLIRQGLRVVAAKYYRRRRPPSTGLFISTSVKLGDESELFKDIVTAAPWGRLL